MTVKKKKKRSVPLVLKKKKCLRRAVKKNLTVCHLKYFGCNLETRKCSRYYPERRGLAQMVRRIVVTVVHLGEQHQ